MVSDGLGGSLIESSNEFQSNLSCDRLEYRRIIQKVCACFYTSHVYQQKSYREAMRGRCVTYVYYTKNGKVYVMSTNQTLPSFEARAHCKRIGSWGYLNRKHPSIELT